MVNYLFKNLKMTLVNPNISIIENQLRSYITPSEFCELPSRLHGNNCTKINMIFSNTHPNTTEPSRKGFLPFTFTC